MSINTSNLGNIYSKSVTIGNIKTQGNSIISTSVNGDININPNGTGEIKSTHTPTQPSSLVTRSYFDSNSVSPSGIQTVSNKSLIDSLTSIINVTDNTKIVRLSAAALSTSSTVTLTSPSASTTIVGTDSSQSLTNKQLISFTNTNVNRGCLTLYDSGNTSSQINYIASGVTSNEANVLAFTTGTTKPFTERARITSAGQLLVNTTTQLVTNPRLQVSGEMYISSVPYINVYRNTNTTVTFAATNAATLYTGAGTILSSNGFSVTNFTITYTGATTFRFYIDMTISITTGGNNTSYYGFLSLNGTEIPETRNYFRTVNNADRRSISCHTILTLSTNNTISLSLVNNTNTSSVVITNASMCIFSLNTG